MIRDEIYHRYVDDEAAEGSDHEEEDREEHEEEEEEAPRAPKDSGMSRKLHKPEVELFKAFVKHAHHQMDDWDEELMGRLVALIASFGKFKRKKTFRFILGCCSDYVTGAFLMRLRDSGVSLKPAHLLQLAEAGAHSHDDLACKVVDMVEQGALSVADEDTRALIAGLVDGPGYTMTQRVTLLCSVGECCRTKSQFVSLLHEFCNRGGILPVQVSSLQTQVAEQFTAFVDLSGPTDLAPLRAAYPDLRQFFDVMQEVLEEEEEADEEGNLKDFVVADDYSSDGPSDDDGPHSEEEEGAHNGPRKGKGQQKGKGEEKERKGEAGKGKRVKRRRGEEESEGEGEEGEERGEGKPVKRRRVEVTREESEEEDEEESDNEEGEESDNEESEEEDQSPLRRRGQANGGPANRHTDSEDEEDEEEEEKEEEGSGSSGEEEGGSSDGGDDSGSEEEEEEEEVEVKRRPVGRLNGVTAGGPMSDEESDEENTPPPNKSGKKPPADKAETAEGAKKQEGVQEGKEKGKDGPKPLMRLKVDGPPAQTALHRKGVKQQLQERNDKAKNRVPHSHAPHKGPITAHNGPISNNGGQKQDDIKRAGKEKEVRKPSAFSGGKKKGKRWLG